MTVEDEELARIRAARQAEIQNQLQAQAEQQAKMEVEQAAAEQEANGSPMQCEPFSHPRLATG